MGKTQTLPIEAEDAHTIDRMSVREVPVEVITRGERRRIWTPEQKRDIVMESLEPGCSPIAVARRHGIGSGLLYTWRRQMMEGQLKARLPMPPSFVPVSAVPVSAVPDGVDAAAEAPMPPMQQAAPRTALSVDTSARIEIVLSDGVTVRVGAAADEAALRRVLAALGRR
jgi:transposase